MKKIIERNHHFSWLIRTIISALLFAGFFSGLVSCTPEWDIHNPYSGVDWNEDKQYKANFHTHTTMSDGRVEPAKAIDLYHSLGYDILAITDHDTRGQGNDPDHPERHKTVWPWQDLGRDPGALGMIAIEGNEVSNTHHIVSLFNDYGDPEVECEHEVLREIADRDGLAILAHPGLYRQDNWARRLRERDELWSEEKAPTAWYVDLLSRHDHLVGFEVFIQGDRSEKDHFEIWDAVLTEVSAERSVWGFSNDDMHRSDDHLGYNWNIMLLPGLSKERVRRAMEDGNFLFVYSQDGHNGPAPPKISSIGVNTRKGTIRIDATDHERIDWISEGKVVHSGDAVNLSEIEKLGGYIRAMIHAPNSNTVVGTQPFRIHSDKADLLTTTTENI